MSCYKAQTHSTHCPVYQLTINDMTRSARSSCAAHYFNTTSCCGKLKTVHHKCAIRFYSKIDNTYKFDPNTYEGDKKTKLLRMKNRDIFSIVKINVTAY